MPELGNRQRVRALGHRAAVALRASGGWTTPLPDFPDAPYAMAGDEIIWIGESGAMHPRAVFVDQPTSREHLSIGSLTPWSAPALDLDATAVARLHAALSNLAATLAAKPGAHGFAPLLAARRLAFPLQARRAAALTLGRTARADDPLAFADAAQTLLGLGSGLTPSGDDYVGGALFALHAIHPRQRAWQAAAAGICRLAASRTHAISAALLADLASGDSFAALHEMVAAAAAGLAPATLAASVHGLTAIGHSSGWDMLTGLLAATAGLPEDLTAST